MSRLAGQQSHPLVWTSIRGCPVTFILEDGGTLDLAEGELRGDLGVDPRPPDGIVGALEGFLMQAAAARYRAGPDSGER